MLGGWRLNSGKMGVNGLTYYAALPQRTLAATAGMVILVAFVLAGGLVAVLLICRRSTSVLYAPVDDLMHAASDVFGQPGSDEGGVCLSGRRCQAGGPGQSRQCKA